MGQEFSLIRFFDFYLLFFFIANTLRRLGQYRNAAHMVFSVPKKWPLLFDLVKKHRTIFMTMSTIVPGLFALVLAIAQIVSSRVIWPEAGKPPDGLTAVRLWEHWQFLFAIVPLGLLMLSIDFYGLVVVGEMDRQEMEKHFEQAEYWLRSKTATVVRVFTFGFVNPRRMVADEVKKSLLVVSKMLNHTLWWVTVQLGCRLVFGLSLWLTWASIKT